MLIFSSMFWGIFWGYKMRILIGLILYFALVFMVGCAPYPPLSYPPAPARVPYATGSYAPPPAVVSASEPRVIQLDQPFEDVWHALISYSGSAFFGIDNFEKASGLLTLSFTAETPSLYVTGGRLTRIAGLTKVPILSGHASSQVVLDSQNSSIGASRLRSVDSYAGDWVGMLQQEAGLDLQGRINLVVKPLGPARTEVVINVRYDLVFGEGALWFDSGSCADWVLSNPLRGTPSIRTICPTYRLETDIMDSLKK